MIEDVQKVNKLAQELLHQGMAADREDAVKKAQEMLNKNISSPHSVTSEKTMQNDMAKLDVAKCMDLINKTRDQMSAQIDTFSAKINEIIKEINDIQSKIKSGIAVKQSSQEPKQEKQESLKKDEPHPKRGNLTSEDVSVEKMFYYGNK